jgi:hypothetical protein
MNGSTQVLDPVTLRPGEQPRQLGNEPDIDGPIAWSS